MDWLETYLQQTEESESPRQFFYWSALAALSGVLKNNLYLERYYYKLYPNIFVLLIAKSGLKKGVPVLLAKNIVEAVDNNRVIHGRSSVQAIITDLSQAFTRESGGPPITEATAFISSGELSTAFVRDQDSLTIMTDLYDSNYNEKWRNSLKGSGQEQLKSVCLTLLGALNPTHYNDLVTVKEVTGGFVGRCILVQADKRARKNPLTRPPKVRFDTKMLSDHLRLLATIKGEFQWSPEGMEFYEGWYDKWNPEEHEDKTGSLNRVADTVLKAAMLIALARRGENVLRPNDIEESIRECLPRAKAAEHISSHGESPIATLKKKFIQILLSAQANTASKQHILRHHYMDFDVATLDSVVETLELGGVITVERGLEITYQLKPEVAEKFRVIVEAIEKGQAQVKKEEAS